MRGTAAALAAVTLTVVLTGCSSSGGKDARTVAACTDMKNAFNTFGAQQLTDPQAIGQAYATMAQRIQTDLDRARDGSVRSAARKVIDALHILAADMQAAANGDVKIPPTAQLSSSVHDLQKACTT